MGTNLSKWGIARHRAWAFVIVVLMVVSIFATGKPQPVYAGAETFDGVYYTLTVDTTTVVRFDTRNRLPDFELQARDATPLTVTGISSGYYSVYAPGTSIGVSPSNSFLTAIAAPPGVRFSLVDDIGSLTDGAFLINSDMWVNTLYVEKVAPVLGAGGEVITKGEIVKYNVQRGVNASGIADSRVIVFDTLEPTLSAIAIDGNTPPDTEPTGTFRIKVKLEDPEQDVEIPGLPDPPLITSGKYKSGLPLYGNDAGYYVTGANLA